MGMAPPSGVPPGMHMSPQGDAMPSSSSFQYSSESKEEPRGYGGPSDVLGAPPSYESKEDDTTFGSGGLMQNSASSRARVLQQQREMAMKRRSKQMNSGLMMRSDGPRAAANLMSGMDSQNTPAMRQFSAPKKTVEREDEEEEEDDDGWGDPNANKNVKADFMRGISGKQTNSYNDAGNKNDWINKDSGIDLRGDEKELKRRQKQERRRGSDEEGRKGAGGEKFRGYPEDRRYEEERRRERDRDRNRDERRRGGESERVSPRS